MDDSFQFIIESPQHAQGHKKRPRLVTSCDNCRLKKIKCLQPSPETKCEACKAAKIPCRFRDRERYFAERSRAIAGPSAASNYSSSEQRSDGVSSLDAFSVASTSSSPALSSYSISRSNSRSPKASGIVGADDGGSVRYSPYASDPRRSIDYSHRHSLPYSSSARPSSLGYNSMSPSPGPMMYHSRSQSTSRQVHLFDPDFPQHPAFSLMTDFILLFFNNLGHEYYFIIYEDVYQEFTARKMSPGLANSIAAFAASYSTIPDLAVRGLHNVAETYANAAKSSVNSILHLSSIDTLHVLMLLTWFEYRANRMDGFRHYASLVQRMSTQLRMATPNGTLVSGQGHDNERQKLTMKGLYHIQMTAAQLR